MFIPKEVNESIMKILPEEYTYFGTDDRPLMVNTLFDIDDMSEKCMQSWLFYRHPISAMNTSANLKERVALNFATHVNSPPLSCFLDFSIEDESTSFLCSWLGSFGLYVNPIVPRNRLEQISHAFQHKMRDRINDARRRLIAQNDEKGDIVELAGVRAELRRLLCRLMMKYILPYIDENGAPKRLIFKPATPRVESWKGHINRAALAVAHGPGLTPTELREIFHFKIDSGSHVSRIRGDSSFFTNLSNINSLGWRAGEAVNPRQTIANMDDKNSIMTQIIQTISRFEREEANQNNIFIELVERISEIMGGPVVKFIHLRDGWLHLSKIMNGTISSLLKNK